MNVYVVDKWDSENLVDSEVDKVFHKKENALDYIKESKEQLSKWIRDADEDEVNKIPKYEWRITPCVIEELK